MTEYTTTLNAIRAASPCKGGWEKLLAHLGKAKADDEPLELLTVLDSNGVHDALWVLSNVMQPDHDRLSRHFQAWCAEQVLHLFEAERPDDRRVRDQIATLRNDDASPEMRVAARAAAGAAGVTVRAAARAAAGVVIWDTAGAAAWGATRAASWDASRSAAGAAGAAGAAARHAVYAVAGTSAWNAARAAQEQQLRKMITEGF